MKIPAKKIWRKKLHIYISASLICGAFVAPPEHYYKIYITDNSVHLKLYGQCSESLPTNCVTIKLSQWLPIQWSNMNSSSNA